MNFKNSEYFSDTKTKELKEESKDSIKLKLSNLDSKFINKDKYKKKEVSQCQ